MNNENKSIHEFQFQLICDYFTRLERQGPGSEETTRKALSFIHNLPVDAKMADIGCGTGTQTITLAENTTGHIKAIDLFPEFINILNSRIKDLNYDSRIKAVIESMDSLSFEESELNLIWSEGAIYNIGFERGLNEWKKYLKKGGYIAVSEVSWFTEERPAEINDFWKDAYPEIDIISNKVRQMENAGYRPVAHFIIPESDWIEGFYNPMAPAREAFLEKYNNDEIAVDFVHNQQHEEKLYHKYKSYYGYVFYIGQKI